MTLGQTRNQFSERLYDCSHRSHQCRARKQPRAPGLLEGTFSTIAPSPEHIDRGTNVNLGRWGATLYTKSSARTNTEDGSQRSLNAMLAHGHLLASNSKRFSTPINPPCQWTHTSGPGSLAVTFVVHGRGWPCAQGSLSAL